MEKEFVEWLVENYQKQGKNTPIGLGDDAAIVELPSSRIVVSTDTIADGTHFESGRHSLEMIGHKAMAVSLSDIAAMGARPVSATVNFTCPPEYRLSHLKQLFEGMWNTGQRYGAAIVGGDTNRWKGKLVVGSTLIGSEVENAVGGFWTMCGGQAGDQIFVSGTLGGSILGKHIQFTPRVDLASKLASNYLVSAATDITDSLSLDLATLARKSGCGFRIEEELLPLADDARTLADTSGQSALKHALFDGEDFELIVCVSPSVAEQLAADPKFEKELKRIGELTANREFLIKDGESGKDVALEIRGFRH